MATLHMMVALPGSGKTTQAKRLVQALRAGMDVILDFGFWTKSERDGFRQAARDIGADSKIHFMDVPLDEIWRRLEARNQSAGENAVFYVGRRELDEWAALFEAPTAQELE